VAYEEVEKDSDRLKNRFFRRKEKITKEFEDIIAKI
jgi:hypothetical protein